jgi:hypothetical protein
MGKRIDLGNNWSEVVEKWYLGLTPTINGNIGWEGLSTLEYLWPESIDDFLSKNHRGQAVIAPLVERGIVLTVCNKLPGFDKVLERIKSGERSAFSEAFFAANLLKMGLNPIFEPVLNGKRPDFLIHFKTKSIYIEIISPDTSDLFKQAYNGMNELSYRLQNQLIGKKIDVNLMAEPTLKVIDIIIHNVLKQTEDGILEIPEIALIQKNELDPTNNAIMKLPELHNSQGPILCVVGMKMGEGETTHVNVQYAITDERADRLMIAESHHFSKDECNLLVMDVTQVPSGIKSWLPLLRRRFQPDRNTRFGGVCLFENYPHEVKWSIEENPFASNPLPKEFIENVLRLQPIGR